MKVVILAGGLGTRLSEETTVKPKPMVEIGSEPIIWHIMKIYYHFGFNDFIICAGYKQNVIKEYFRNYELNHCDAEFSTDSSNYSFLNSIKEKWTVKIIDTGLNTMTGGRIKRISRFLKDQEDFLLTYGDGVADININDLLSFHRRHGKLATVTAVQPIGRFGRLFIEDGDRVASYSEKRKGDDGWVNAGFYVLNKRVIDFIEGDNTTWEQEPMSELAKIGELRAYKHVGFWEPMDTLNDKRKLEEKWAKNPPWRFWND